MSKISIHIGLHKTGTSFLQNNLLKNLPETSVVKAGIAIDNLWK